ncbi:MAG TPA: transposase [Usitatibacter sp.]
MRGNDRQPIFFSDGDRLYFLKCLGEARSRRLCDIHAFVLMSNHVHILATPRVDRAVSRMMQDVGRAYVTHVNKVHGRTGALYEGRFKSSLVETTRYFLACMRYIEMNPVRAQIASQPGGYEWSSYGQNITGEPGGLVTPHAEFLNLGRDASQRAKSYAHLFDEPETDDVLSAIRRAAAQGGAIGTPTYCQALTTLLGKPVSFMRRGRPACSVPFSEEKGSDPF